MKWEFQKLMAQWDIDDLNSDVLHKDFVAKATGFLGTAEDPEADQEKLVAEDKELCVLFNELHEFEEEESEEAKTEREVKEKKERETKEKLEKEKKEKEAKEKKPPISQNKHDQVIAKLASIKERGGTIHYSEMLELGIPEQTLGSLFFNWNGFGFNKKVFFKEYYVESPRG
uniref:Uncharacterized protein n=1 Tax=viral metagenome TaxID=1070528 RepID=A0A6M3KGW1_9ZZZZ